MLLEEFDANKTAIINPDMCVEKIENFPEITISCFSEELFNEVLEFFQFFYAGDNLDHSSWEPRSISGSTRLDEKSKIMLLAFELGFKILEKL
jgi:hypothetical protein